MAGHVVGNHQPHDAAEAPLPHPFLDGLQQIFRFQFFDGDIRVAGDMERMGLDHVHAAEQGGQIGGDHLFQPDKSLLTRRVLPLFLRGRFSGTNCGRESGTLTRAKCSTPSLSRINGEVQAEVGNMRERPTRIEGQRGEHGKDGVAEKSVRYGELLLVQLRIIHDLNGGFREGRQKLFVPGTCGPRSTTS